MKRAMSADKKETDTPAQTTPEISARLQRLNRTPVPEIVLNQLKQLIIELNLSSGDKLPSERKLSEVLGASRPSIRSAIKILETLNVVTVKHGVGVFLRQPDFGFLSFPITLLLSYEGGIFDELIEARQKIELDVIDLVVDRATDEDLDNLREKLENLSSDKAIKNIEGSYNFDFEQELARIAKNRPLQAVQGAMHTIWEGTLRQVSGRVRPISLAMQEHWDIFRAIQDRDVDRARSAMIEHLRRLSEIRLEK